MRLPALLPEEGSARPLVRLLDEARQPLRLERVTDAAEVRVLEERLPEVRGGAVQTVAGTGVRVAGGGPLQGGAYGLVVGLWAQDHTSARLLRSEVMRHLRRAAYAQSVGLLYELAGEPTLVPTWRGSSALGSTVTATWEVARPYQLGPLRDAAVPVGVATPLDIGGDAPCDLTVEITAGAAPVVDPAVTSASGVTTWEGTIPPGETLVIDAAPGRWAVTLAGADVHRQLLGPQPVLTPDAPTVRVDAAGASARIRWQEGVL